VHVAYFGDSVVHVSRYELPTLVSVSTATKERHCAATALDRFLRNPKVYGLLG
jgi:hypothetical protein